MYEAKLQFNAPDPRPLRLSPAATRALSGDFARIQSYRPRPDQGRVARTSIRSGLRQILFGAGRGRALRAAVLVAVMLALMTLGFAKVAGAASGPTYDTVVVRQGDTLWSIASSRYPGDDPRARIDDIERANNLSGPVVHAGDRLVLPRSN